MTRHLTAALAAAALLGGPAVSPTAAQEPARPRPVARPAPPRQSRNIEIGGFAVFGRIDFAAAQSFDAILGEHAGLMFGGGARIGLPIGGLFAEVGAWRFRGDGERVFIFDGTRYPLGIDEDITVTPIEFSAGWRVRFRRAPKVIPYVAGGFTSLRYQETSDHSESAEDVDENFGGYHFKGGVEYKIRRWLGVGGEAQWSTIPDAIGTAGVSETFKETDLGGTALRVKITIGR